MDHTTLPNVKKIAVFRATALGDFIFTLPALEGLHRAYPEAELVYLGRAWHSVFLPGRLPGAHRVIAVPPPRTVEQIRAGLVIDPQAEDDFFWEMRAEGIDLALQMHGGGGFSNPFVRSLGARFCMGMKAPTAPPLDRWIPYIYYQNEVARMIEVAGLAGAAPVHLQPHLPVLAGDLSEAAPILDQIDGPFVVLHPGSTDPRRCWSPEKFAAVGDACAALGLRVVLTGTSTEAERMQAVAGQMRSPVLNLCGLLSLPGLVGLLSRATLFAGNDSGPLHLALAVGARAVGLFWVEYIVNSLPQLRKNFYPLIAWRRTCPLCGSLLDKAEADNPSGACPHAISMVEEIMPADVLSGIEALLA